MPRQAVAMQPPVVSLADCSLFLCSFKQSKTAAKLKEDMKKIAAQRGCTGSGKVFGISLLELQQQRRGLAQNGIPSVVCDVVEYLNASGGLRQEGLFRVCGSVRMVDQLRLKYENGEEVELARDGDVNSAASLLKLFLRELPDSVITAALQPRFIQLYKDNENESEMEAGLKKLIQELPEAHHSLLKYLCQFLAGVAEHHMENRMNVFNLATVFGPSFFRLPTGSEGMKELETCNRIVIRLLESHSTLFESELTTVKEEPCEDTSRIIIVKEAIAEQSLPINLTNDIRTDIPKPSPRKKVFCEHAVPLNLTSAIQRDVPKPLPRRKAPVSKCEAPLQLFSVPQPEHSVGTPVVKLGFADRITCVEDMDLADEISINSPESPSSSQEDDRPMSPFYLSAHVPVSQTTAIPASGEFIERTIRSAVEQHLFDVYGSGGQSSEDSESGTSSASPVLSARQRRRHHKEQDEARRNREREVVNKENIPSVFGGLEDCILTAQETDKLQENCSSYIEERIKPKRQKSSSKLSELNENQDSPLGMEGFGTPRTADQSGTDSMEVLSEASKENEFEGDYLRHPQISNMKFQGHQSNPEARQQKSQDASSVEESFAPEVPRLDLSSLCDDKNREEPVLSLPSWQQEETEAEEACLSPQPGHLIRQLLDGDSDPMLSPRFYAYGQNQQYLDDTEVPPSPPNSHSFMSRRRSSSLGSYEDDGEDLSPAQLTRKIQSLKKKIRKFEEKFEEERKYRPSHSDKAGNPEVLKWMNELAKFRKQLKESKLKQSEEDLAPQVRQRSNTLPKSFGSQLEKEEERKQESMKPTVEATLETIQRRLQEKRAEANRPEDIKDMTRDEIAAEKVSLQKALLYYESIHGRPATKNERQVMKPLYDRYRLVKQILHRASTIPVIGSPSSKRRSPLLQPIIEGETASFFKDIKEEEDGSEDDDSVKSDFVVTAKPDFSLRNFLEHLEDGADGFISPMDDNMSSKNSQDLGLSNLHSASMPELMEQLQEAREEKKKIRKTLKDFEDDFFRQNSRNVQKEDRAPMAEEYSKYKHIKAKLRLLEVLISKRDMSKVV